ncbi:hypothetical protein [Sphingomonas sp. YL-JM2C]
MTGDREIWACAHQLMQRYGDAASFHAAQRADEMFAANDLEGGRIWIRILRRIEDLANLRAAGPLQ